MATLGAFFDANVLYPSALRNFLMHLALTGLFRAHWSAEVHEEWIRNLLKNRPDLTAAKLARTRRLMDEAFPEALVSEYEHLIDSIVLPDPDDRHVVAAAIRFGAGVIVTRNLKDFPDHVLGRFNIEAQNPDDFVIVLMDISVELVLEAARNHRASLRNPPKTTDEYLSELAAQGLTNTMAALRNQLPRCPEYPFSSASLYREAQLHSAGDGWVTEGLNNARWSSSDCISGLNPSANRIPHAEGLRQSPDERLAQHVQVP